MAWESISDRAKFLGLCVFNKIDSHQTRPLIRNCMPPKNTGNTRANGTYIKQKFQSVNFSNSFLPFFSEMWSKLDKSLREEVDLNEFKSKLKPSFKPKRHKHFNCGSKYGITLLCRLRLGRSFLKAHGFAINLINVCGAELKAHLIICLTVINFLNNENACWNQLAKFCQILQPNQNQRKSKYCLLDLI